MSDRERWIVYPLLFFAMLLGARDRIAPPNPLKCDALECRTLMIRSPSGNELVKLFPTDAGAVLRFSSYDTDETEEAGDRISLKAAPLRTTLEIGSDGVGGYVTSLGTGDVVALKLGHHKNIKGSGLIARDKNGDPLGGTEETGEMWSLIPWDQTEEETAEEVTEEVTEEAVGEK